MSLASRQKSLVVPRQKLRPACNFYAIARIIAFEFWASVQRKRHSPSVNSRHILGLRKQFDTNGLASLRYRKVPVQEVQVS